MIGEEEFKKKYGFLTDWLINTFIESEYDEFDDNVIIKKYFDDYNLMQLKQAIKEAEEVLALEPFPEELVEDLTYRYSPIMTQKEWLQGFKEKLQAKIDEVEGNTKPNKLESNKTISKDNNVLKFPGINIRSDE